MEENIRAILRYIGENPDRAGLVDTPKRVIKMRKEVFYGYREDLFPTLTTFSNNDDGRRDCEENYL